MQSYIKSGIVCVAVCTLPLTVLSKTTSVQEYDFSLIGPQCVGDDCFKTTTCPSNYKYTCSSIGVIGKGLSCYDTTNPSDRKTLYTSCECDSNKGYISETELYHGSKGVADYGTAYGDEKKDGVICYKKSEIKCAAGYPEYKDYTSGVSHASLEIVKTPVTYMTLSSNYCIRYEFKPLLKENHISDNILCLTGYSCNANYGCYDSNEEALSRSVTNCYTSTSVTGSGQVRNTVPICYTINGCKTEGYCGGTKPGTGITYKAEELKGYTAQASKAKMVSCYKSTGCTNQWTSTDPSDLMAFKTMITDITTTPSKNGSHVFGNITGLGMSCKAWSACNTAAGWEEFPNNRGVGATQKSAAVVAAAFEHNATYDVSVLSQGTEEEMHYFICRRPTSIVCQPGQYMVECSEGNSCSWLKFFLPD